MADTPPLFSLIPQQSDGWLGTPGLVGSRNGLSQFSSFVTHTIDQTPSSMIAYAHDDEANIDLSIELEITDEGLLRTRAILTNAGEDGYNLDSLLLALPTPATETYVIDQSGHHLRERDTHTHEFTIGSHRREIHVARGHSVSTIHGTCQEATSWQRGLVHYVHVAWSGNTCTIAERDTQGLSLIHI